MIDSVATKEKEMDDFISSFFTYTVYTASTAPACSTTNLTR